MNAPLQHTVSLRTLLASKGLKYVGTRGNVSAPVCFVGEAPGEHEDIAGLPFVGASGQELDRMSRDAGLQADDCWFTSSFKVRPPNNQIGRLNEYGIELSTYIDQFLEEIRFYRPTLIIACGATPLSILCPFTLSKRDGTPRIAQFRGSLLSSPVFDWPHYVIPMYHPAFILREWAERPTAVFCLARVAEELAYLRQNGKLRPLPERQLIVEPSFDDVYTFLHDIARGPYAKKPVSIDIEMLGGRFPYTISLAPSRSLGISFSLSHYPEDQLAKLWRLLDEIFRTNPQIGQNYLGFDSHWLESLGFQPTPTLVDDTMVRHHVLWPELEHKLQFLTFQYTREPYYKDEGRTWKPKDGKRGLMVYNAKDSTVTYEVWEGQQEEFESNKKHLYPFYRDYQMPLAANLFNVEKRGIYVNADRLTKVRDYINAETIKCHSTIAGHVGRTVCVGSEEQKRLEKLHGKGNVFNVNSPAQLIPTLKQLGIKIPKARGTGKESTSEEVLNNLYAETGHPILKEVLRNRELTKMLGTYVNAKLANNVLYSSYVVTGTVTGRRSARRNVFGFGTNHQNLPNHSELGKKFRHALVARPGKIFVACDQVQAEDWLVQGIIADVSGHRTGLEELIAGIDRHKKLACFLFNKPESECGKDTPFRFMGKKTRHAGNYDMGAFRFAQAMATEGYSVPEKHCEYLLESFHQFDPHIRGVFHKHIQDTLRSTRTLRNLFGREREFMSLRPFSDNVKIFKEGYAYIPQGTVGDNTGLAINYIESRSSGELLLESHDAVTLEVDDNQDAITSAVKLLANSFWRDVVFPNGLRFVIPIEVELGYDLKDTAKVCEIRYDKLGREICHGNWDDPGLTNTLVGLKSRLSPQEPITSGAAQA